MALPAAPLPMALFTAYVIPPKHKFIVYLNSGVLISFLKFTNTIVSKSQECFPHRCILPTAEVFYLKSDLFLSLVYI